MSLHAADEDASTHSTASGPRLSVPAQVADAGKSPRISRAVTAMTDGAKTITRMIFRKKRLDGTLAPTATGDDAVSTTSEESSAHTIRKRSPHTDIPRSHSSEELACNADDKAAAGPAPSAKKPEPGGRRSLHDVVRTLKGELRPEPREHEEFSDTDDEAQSPDVNVKWLERFKLQQKYEDTTKKLSDARADHARVMDELGRVPLTESTNKLKELTNKRLKAVQRLDKYEKRLARLEARMTSGRDSAARDSKEATRPPTIRIKSRGLLGTELSTAEADPDGSKSDDRARSPLADKRAGVTSTQPASPVALAVPPPIIIADAAPTLPPPRAAAEPRAVKFDAGSNPALTALLPTPVPPTSSQDAGLASLLLELRQTIVKMTEDRRVMADTIARLQSKSALRERELSALKDLLRSRREMIATEMEDLKHSFADQINAEVSRVEESRNLVNALSARVDTLRNAIEAQEANVTGSVAKIEEIEKVLQPKPIQMDFGTMVLIAGIVLLIAFLYFYK
eukprot:m.81252 g.81252  ORF g.81252 m.81252 type:complete len:511 (-) comp8073_c1_seq3:268-1800(-)